MSHLKTPAPDADFLDPRTGKISREWLSYQQALSRVVPEDDRGNTVVGHGAIDTAATDGFLYVPTCAGVPTGVPRTYTGRAAMVVDSTNNRLYFYSNGAWRNAGP